MPERGSTNDQSTPASPDSTGSIAAIEQMAGWARFGDTKATILAAGLGVVATMFTNSATAVMKAIHGPCPVDLVVGGLALLTVLSFLWTLYWLVRAIAPRSDIPYSGLNRFAWPSLVRANADQLVAHVQQTDVEADAWQQVIDLAVVAQRKFYFCKQAVYGFGVTVVAGLASALLAASVIPPKS